MPAARRSRNSAASVKRSGSRQPCGKESSLRSANHNPRCVPGRVQVSWCMLRLKVLVSAVPLIAAAVFARFELFSGPLPCIAIGADTLQIAAAPWHADLPVSFTDDPALATVRVAVSDRAETADFAVIDDVDDTDDSACLSTPATRFVAISA